MSTFEKKRTRTPHRLLRPGKTPQIGRRRKKREKKKKKLEDKKREKKPPWRQAQQVVEHGRSWGRKIQSLVEGINKKWSPIDAVQRKKGARPKYKTASPMGDINKKKRRVGKPRKKGNAKTCLLGKKRSHSRRGSRGSRVGGDTREDLTNGNCEDRPSRVHSQDQKNKRTPNKK